MLSNFFSIFTSNSSKEIYSGYRATLMRNVPSAIIRFALYEEIKLRFVGEDDDGTYRF